MMPRPLPVRPSVRPPPGRRAPTGAAPREAPVVPLPVDLVLITTTSAGSVVGAGPFRSVVHRSARGRAHFVSGTSRSVCWISSMETSRKVRTLADFTKRLGRYMSQTQASPRETS